MCVYNNKEKLENFLIKSLNKQDSNDYELILVDNRNCEFKSAASALNYGATKIKTNSDYWMFVHQNIEITEDNFFQKNENPMKNLKNPGIMGVAGRERYNRRFIVIFMILLGERHILIIPL
ncbi:MAG: glycosyltransferase family 2 protein [Methanobrevibacter sp.]|nr:glycosyltransferase family 2 protein [Methanobrevibacter sp.]